MINPRRFFQFKQNWLALFLVTLFIFIAAAAPWLAPPDEPGQTIPYRELRSANQRLPNPPRADAPLGTVPKAGFSGLGMPQGQGGFYQWDIYYTLIWGARSALRFGLTVTLLTATFGILLGAISAYIGGLANRVLMRITDAFLTFPPIAAVWLLHRAIFSRLSDPFGLPLDLSFGQQLLVDLQIDAVMVALVFFSWMPYARIVNATVSQLMNTDFIMAARAMGAAGPRIVFRHLLPNAISPAIVMAARDVGGMVVLASAFIFIGLGGNVAWGIILVGGRDYIIGFGGNPFYYWWTFVPIALAIILFGVGWNLLGDGLNTMLNPRSR